MSEPPTASSLHVQGGMGGQDPVAESNEKVRKLEAEKTKLQRAAEKTETKIELLQTKIELLEEYCYSKTTEQRRTELEEDLRSKKIYVQTVDFANVKRAELAENLKSVNTQLAEAQKKLTLAMQQLTLAMQVQAPQVCSPDTCVCVADVA